MLKIEHLLKMRPLINIKALALLSDIRPGTLNAKLIHKRPLTTDESERIENTFKNYGIMHEPLVQNIEQE